MTFASSASSRFARNALRAVSLATATVLVTLGSAAAADSAGRTSYVFMSPGGHSSTVNGNSGDYERAQAYRKGDEGLLYFRQGGTAYVVRDAELLRRADAIMAPQQALGAKQGELGGQQGELGSRQAALGSEQARASMSGASSHQRMSELGRQQAELGRQQAALGARQAELGRQQAALGKAAEKQIQALISDAIRRGLATRVQ